MSVVAQQWVSLDGYASGVDGEEEIFAAVGADSDAASQEYNARFLPSVTEVLLGRRSYEKFVGYWPTAQEPIADRVNAIPKTVCSTTLTRAPWGSHEPAGITADAVEHVRRADGLVLVWGSLRLTAALLAAGVLDELDLFLAPVVLGAGIPLVPPGLHPRLRQLTSEPLGSVTHLRYRIER